MGEVSISVCSAGKMGATDVRRFIESGTCAWYVVSGVYERQRPDMHVYPCSDLDCPECEATSYERADAMVSEQLALQERDTDESLAHEIAKDAARLLGVDAANARGDFWASYARAIEDGKLRSKYNALATLYYEGAMYTQRTQKGEAA